MAIKLFERASKSGHPESQFRLAYAYDVGKGKEKNQKKAFFWYCRSLAGRYAEARHNVARYYLHGWGTTSSLELAMKNFHIAARSGDPESQYGLGFCYKISEKKSSIRLALHWYRKAARQGHADAQIAVQELGSH